MKAKKTPVLQNHFMSTTVLGERGQVVIPKDLRDAVGLEAGSRVVVMHHGHGPILIFPMDEMKDFMDGMRERFAKFDVE